tara:strand:- start:9181 stop:9369 length:189 start_codon:yes stop_codon:yes gene_type:complete
MHGAVGQSSCVANVQSGEGNKIQASAVTTVKHTMNDTETKADSLALFQEKHRATIATAPMRQ